VATIPHQGGGGGKDVEHPPIEEAQVPAKFQLKKGTTGKYRFVVLASNGQVVATSQVYERKASALAGIRSIEKIVTSAAAIEDTTTKEWAAAEAAKKTAEAAKKAAKKNGVKRNAVKKPAKAAVPAKAVGKQTPARKRPPPLTTPPERLVPRI